MAPSGYVPERTDNTNARTDGRTVGRPENLSLSPHIVGAESKSFSLTKIFQLLAHHFMDQLIQNLASVKAQRGRVEFHLD